MIAASTSSAIAVRSVLRYDNPTVSNLLSTSAG
jgi:hypothetical protein